MPGIKAENLVFIDESGANLMMDLSYARAEGGARIKMPKPHARGSTFSMIGAVTFNKVLAATYGEWSTTGEIFNTFLERCLCPKLKPYHHVLLDNISFHKSDSAIKLIENTGAKIIYLPPYSPEFSPIENMWSKVKNILRKLAARTVDDFHKGMRVAFKSISAENLSGWFNHCGYIVDR